MVKKRDYVCKVLLYFAIILFLLLLIIVEIKKWHLSLWLKCQTNENWVNIQQNQLNVPFLFYASFLDTYMLSYFVVFFKIIIILLIYKVPLFYIFVRLTSYTYYARLNIGTFSCWVSTSILLGERRFDKMKKRIFIIRFLRYLSIILLLLIIMIIVIKKWHSFDRISV